MMLFPKFLDIAMPDYHQWKKRNHKQVAPVYSGTPCPPAWRPGNPLSISCTSPEPFGGGSPRQAMRVENHVGVPLSAMNSFDQPRENAGCGAIDYQFPQPLGRRIAPSIKERPQAA
jgi:hypothetical protein